MMRFSKSVLMCLLFVFSPTDVNAETTTPKQDVSPREITNALDSTTTQEPSAATKSTTHRVPTTHEKSTAAQEPTSYSTPQGSTIPTKSTSPEGSTSPTEKSTPQGSTTPTWGTTTTPTESTSPQETTSATESITTQGSTTPTESTSPQETTSPTESTTPRGPTSRSTPRDPSTPTESTTTQETSTSESTTPRGPTSSSTLRDPTTHTESTTARDPTTSTQSTTPRETTTPTESATTQETFTSESTTPRGPTSSSTPENLTTPTESTTPRVPTTSTESTTPRVPTTSTESTTAQETTLTESTIAQDSPSHSTPQGSTTPSESPSSRVPTSPAEGTTAQGPTTAKEKTTARETTTPTKDTILTESTTPLETTATTGIITFTPGVTPTENTTPQETTSPTEGTTFQGPTSPTESTTAQETSTSESTTPRGPTSSSTPGDPTTSTESSTAQETTTPTESTTPQDLTTSTLSTTPQDPTTPTESTTAQETTPTESTTAQETTFTESTTAQDSTSHFTPRGSTTPSESPSPRVPTSPAEGTTAQGPTTAKEKTTARETTTPTKDTILTESTTPLETTATTGITTFTPGVTPTENTTPQEPTTPTEGTTFQGPTSPTESTTPLASTTPSKDITVASTTVLETTATTDITTFTTEVTTPTENTPPTVNVTDYTICEDTPPGAEAFTIVATDAENDPLTFLFTGANAEYFTLILNTGVVIVKKQLDREANDVMQLTVAVSDGFTSSSYDINVTLSDDNDNKPLFEEAPYHYDCAENTPVGSSLFKVNTTDEDKGPAGVVRYSITEVTPNSGLGLFSISEISGEVTLTGSLNYTELSTFYRLKIKATDGGGKCYFDETTYLSSDAFANIRVVDVPDLDPMFLGAPYVGKVLENSPVGHTVLKVTAVDQDTGVNDAIIYSIEDSSVDGLFTILDDGVISVLSDIDKENLGGTSTVILTVKATESKENIYGVYASNTTIIPINIFDNGNKPEFYKCGLSCVKESHFAAKVSEHYVGSIDINMTVRDQDKVSNTKLTLGGAYSHVFAVEPQFTEADSSVQLVVRQPQKLDFEQTHQIIVEVIATDQNDATFHSTATVTINIQDINDNTPEFISSNHVFPVESEKTGKGISVAEITASDRDSGKNGQIEFKVISVLFTDNNNQTNNMRLLFEAISKQQKDNYVGTIQTTEKLSVVLKGKYWVTVNATDTGGLFNSTVLEIFTVNEKNEVQLTFSRSVEEVEENLDEIIRVFTAATNATVEILAIIPATTGTGAIIIAYFVYSDGETLPSDAVEEMISDPKFSTELEELGLTDIGGGSSGPPETIMEMLMVMLVAPIIVLAIIAPVIISRHNKYTKVKKAEPKEPQEPKGPKKEKKNRSASIRSQDEHTHFPMQPTENVIQEEEDNERPDSVQAFGTKPAQ